MVMASFAKKESSRGLTDRKICAAVVLGVVLGMVVSLLSLRGGPQAPSFLSAGQALSRAATNSMEVSGSGPGDAASLTKRVKDLEAEKAKLLLQFRTAADERDAARRQLAAGGGGGEAAAAAAAAKPGPPGSVKSQRTNPAVLPDREHNPALAELLEKLAPTRELIVAVSNNNIRGMLQTWFEGLQRAGVTNYLVVALDDEIASFCREHGVPVYRRDAAISAAQQGTGDNHAISGLKFHLLREFLVLGYGVLLSDVDIVFLQDPFGHLFRDCDVESMTDGFDNATAYGYDDVTDDPAMGWARYAHTMRVWVFNSGLFYIRPTAPAIELLDRVTARLAREKAWDQAVFNEELFFPSHPGYDGLHASRRVMDYLLFMNSKVLFRQVRKEARFADHRPVSIHVNYHPDKHPRMLAIVDYYVNGVKNALAHFPDGSE